MVNKCGHCGSAVAGHRAKFVSDPGKGNCNQPPFVPTTHVTSQGDTSPTVSGPSTKTSEHDSMISEHNVVTSVTSVENSVTVSGAGASGSSMGPTTTSASVSDAESSSIVLTNQQLETVLTQKCEALEKQVQEAEAEAKDKLMRNLWHLHDREDQLRKRLQAAQSYQPTVPVLVPPAVQGPPQMLPSNQRQGQHRKLCPPRGPQCQQTRLRMFSFSTKPRPLLCPRGVRSLICNL